MWSMSEKPDPEDPLVATEALLEKARRETERQALAWQKAHQATDQGYDLVRQFNSERNNLVATNSSNLPIPFSQMRQVFPFSI